MKQEAARRQRPATAARDLARAPRRFAHGITARSRRGGKWPAEKARQGWLRKVSLWRVLDLLWLPGIPKDGCRHWRTFAPSLPPCRRSRRIEHLRWPANSTELCSKGCRGCQLASVRQRAHRGRLSTVQPEQAAARVDVRDAWAGAPCPAQLTACDAVALRVLSVKLAEARQLPPWKRAPVHGSNICSRSKSRPCAHVREATMLKI